MNGVLGDVFKRWTRKARGSRLVRDSAWMTAHSGTRIALTALQQLLLARIWGPKDFGTFVLITSFVDLVVIALDPRSQDPIVKYCSEFDARGEKEKALALAGVGFVKNIATAAACGLLVWALAGWGAQTIVHWSEATPLILLYAASYLPFSVRNAGAGVLISRGLFRVLALLGIAGFLFQFLLVVGVAYWGYGIKGGIYALVASQTVSGLVIGIAGLVAAQKAWGRWAWEGSLSSLKDRGQEIIGFFLFNDLTIVAALLFRFTDTLILGWMAGPEAAAYYRLARGFLAAADFVNPALQSVALPRFSTLWGKEDYQSIRLTFQRFALVTGPTLSAATAITLFLLAPYVILFVAGERYLPAVSPTRILCVALFAWISVFWLRPFLLAVGHISFWFYLMFFLSLVAIPGFFVGSQLAAVNGVAWVRSGVEVARAVIGYVRSLQLIRGFNDRAAMPIQQWGKAGVS